MGFRYLWLAVIDILQNTAFHLNAIQTPPFENMTLLDY